MQGRSCGLFNCSQIYYYKYCGLIIQFNVKLTLLSQILTFTSSSFGCRAFLPPAFWAFADMPASSIIAAGTQAKIFRNLIAYLVWTEKLNAKLPPL